ncbi:WhiB family transcription factor [Mycobacterium phage Wamburgrxpress]|uniref:WhiB family transcription factor n=1 Tax=Mycobacterium phage Wamburgrxpress TaxID=2315617 RepID=A0A386KA30_9CAUD|nr:WhiB family transcription factor [Mycobacterium phage Wamburgrxpress]
MSPKPLRWQDEAVCAGDSRFTANPDWLDASDLYEMDELCGGCPVFDQCKKWAEREQATEVFAAGYWRHPNG